MDEYVNNIILQSQALAGYSINANGGSYWHGAARPLEDKVRLAEAYAQLLKAAPMVSVNAIAKVEKVLWNLHPRSLLKLKTVV
jgi:hypothetical protein